jgi:hypothetical protein
LRESRNKLSEEVICALLRVSRSTDKRPMRRYVEREVFATKNDDVTLFSACHRLRCEAGELLACRAIIRSRG